MFINRLINNRKHFVPIIWVAVFFTLASLVYPQKQVDSLKNLLISSEGKNKTKLLIQLGYYLSSENPTEAINYLDEAIALSEKNNDKWSKADALFNKGVALWHLGNISESDDYYNQAKNIYIQFNDSLSIIKVLNSEAINQQMRGEVDKAVEKFFTSLDIAKKVNDSVTVFNTLLNIGVMFDNNNDLDRALNYYLEALNYSNNKNASNLSLLYNYITEIYLTRKSFDLAEKYLNLAIQNSRLFNDERGLVWELSNLGTINVERMNYQAAENYFKEALELAKKSEFKLEIIHALSDLGKFYKLRGNFNEANNFFNEALALSLQLNSLPDLKLIYGQLSELNALQKNFSAAYNYHLKYKEYSDSLFIISNNETVNELQTKYELKQKEQEASSLRKKNELQEDIISSQRLIALIIALLVIVSVVFIIVLLLGRKKLLNAYYLLEEKNKQIEIQRKEILEKNNVLEQNNEVKDKFFSIVAHDLRNPIAAFVSISALLEESSVKLTESDRKDLIKQMNVSSQNLIALLEDLLTWARLSSDKIEIKPEPVVLKDIITFCVNTYEQSAKNKNIKINVNFTSDLVIDTDKFAAQTIFNNLINNAIKFSHNKNVIEINGNKESEFVTLSVKDYGIGMEPEVIKDIFNLKTNKGSRGTADEAGTGLGLVIVKELIDRLNWSIKVKSRINEGSEFILTIPLSLTNN